MGPHESCHDEKRGVHTLSMGLEPMDYLSGNSTISIALIGYLGDLPGVTFGKGANTIELLIGKIRFFASQLTSFSTLR